MYAAQDLLQREQNTVVTRLNESNKLQCRSPMAHKTCAADRSAKVWLTKVQMARMPFLNDLIVVSVLWEEALIAMPELLVGAHNE